MTYITRRRSWHLHCCKLRRGRRPAVEANGRCVPRQRGLTTAVSPRCFSGVPNATTVGSTRRRKDVERQADVTGGEQPIVVLADDSRLDVRTCDDRRDVQSNTRCKPKLRANRAADTGLCLPPCTRLPTVAPRPPGGRLCCRSGTCRAAGRARPWRRRGRQSVGCAAYWRG